ncbi:uncharacterized protein K441DRAFT_585511, partial [Cenococcum geophilum 1.58]|uniref:uncharacterized protein n=1 Tax=Cenococcum geophilum 1.58 TaxID=794803 RepID=UPI00358F1159
INLTALNFKHPLAHNYYRKLSNKKIARLRNIFKLEGCLQLDDENFIKAIIDNNVLAEALRAPGLKVNIFRHRPESIGEIPRLLLLQVDCLNSLYRTSAAK